MFSILQPALVALAMVVAVACALKLFDMNSDFAPILRKISVPFAIIISVVVICVFVFPLISESAFDLSAFAALIFISCISNCVVGYLISIFIDKIIAKYRKAKKFKPAVLPLTLLDSVGALLAGFGLGGCFYSNGTGILAAVALGLFLLAEKVAIVRRYQNEWTRRQIITNLAITLAIIPLVVLAVIYFCSLNLAAGLTLLALGCGYLLYRVAFHLFFIAKSLKKS